MNSSKREREREMRKKEIALPFPPPSLPRRDDPSLIKTRSKLIPIKNRERAALMLRFGYTGIIFVPGGNFLGFATKRRRTKNGEEGCGG